MFDYLFRDKHAGVPDSSNPISQSTFSVQQVKNVVPTVWSEHCLECSPPQCYQSCEIFGKRRDGRCVRIEGGIVSLSNPPFMGIDSGFFRFRRWAKIECEYAAKAVTLQKTLSLYRKLGKIERIVNSLSDALPNQFEKTIRFVNDAWFSARRKTLLHFLAEEGQTAESLCLWISAYVTQDTNMIVEISNPNDVFFREMVRLTKGESTSFLQLPEIGNTTDLTMVKLYPERFDETCELTIHALEVIQTDEQTADILPSDKKTDNNVAVDKKKQMIKCVVWDLDNTMWQGTLAEDKDIILNDHVVDVIKMLDSHGIVNSICSKNDYDAANHKLIEYGIREYFVFPRINWNPKSVNIKEIASSINIALSSMAFVDDSVFERSEVSESCSEVMVIDIKEIDNALESWCFQVETSRESKDRRRTYQMLEKQQVEKESWTGDNDAFLLNCEMKLFVSKPLDSELIRCHELVQRTNQLNISGQVITYDELLGVVTSSHQEAYVLKCKDKFGDYGIIGFAVIEQNGQVPLITDMFLSCRVANRKVEYAFFLWLLEKYKNAGRNGLRVLYRKTDRNTPIRLVLDKVVSTVILQSDDIFEYDIDADKIYGEKQVVDVFEI